MDLVVQKYGGTSVGSAERIRAVAGRIARARESGKDVVVVASAMGDTTDELISLAKQITDQPDDRELDQLLSTGEMVSCTLLAMALRSLGHQSVSLNGAQAGIRTDSFHRRARILSIEPQRITSELERGRIVIVAGFQGITEEMDITTLGRGGSDLTAVALAARMGARLCEIYTDVEGVHTADPRIEPDARKLADISYEEMVELATQGARVMHPRAVEVGQVYGLPILVASSFSHRSGTLIQREVVMEARNKVRGIAHDTDVAKVTVLGVPDQPGIAASIFEPLAEAGISVDTIVQNASVERITDLTFTVGRNELGKAMGLVDPVARSIGARGCTSDETMGKVSIVGTGMTSSPGYAARMFKALYQAGINIELITTSEIRITCIIAQDQVQKAVRTLHRAFELEKAD